MTLLNRNIYEQDPKTYFYIANMINIRIHRLFLHFVFLSFFVDISTFSLYLVTHNCCIAINYEECQDIICLFVEEKSYEVDWLLFVSNI